MNKQPEITDATREALTDSFCSLALRKPIGDMTVREIAEESGHNRTTFYRYFTSVYDLLDHLEDSMIEGFLQSVKTGKNAFEFDDSFFRSIIGYMRDHRDRLLVVFGESNRSSFIAKLQKWIMRNMGMENSEHNRITMTIYFSGITAALTAWLEDNSAVNEEDLISVMGRLFTRWYLPEITGGNSEPENKKE